MGDTLHKHVKLNRFALKGIKTSSIILFNMIEIRIEIWGRFFICKEKYLSCYLFYV